MIREEIFEKVAALNTAFVAFEALWDGDTTGWFIRFSAVTSDGKSHPLKTLSGGGDIRLFNGQVPPWPEAVVAEQIGNELAELYHAEFYFPSPNHPEDDCPDWKDRDKGYPCRRCGILLLQRDGCPWRGICYHCHLAEEREQREAKWAPEQRSGPRCHICGDPATNELNGGLVCAGCFDKYEVYNCEKCDVVTMLPKSHHHTSLCRRCELQKAIDALTEAQRQAIRTATAKSDWDGMRAVWDVMKSFSIHDARYVLRILGDENATNNVGEANV